MHPTGSHLFPTMDRVIFGRPMAKASPRRRSGWKRRVFLVVSRTLNTKTPTRSPSCARRWANAAPASSTAFRNTPRATWSRRPRGRRSMRKPTCWSPSAADRWSTRRRSCRCAWSTASPIPGWRGSTPFETKPGPDGRPVRAEFRGPSVRMIAVPSTLSGGEYNAGCLVTDTRRKLKQTFFHPLMMPLAIVLDPAPRAARAGDAVDRLRHARHGPRDRGPVLAKWARRWSTPWCCDGIRRWSTRCRAARPTRQHGSAPRLPDRLVAVLLRPAVARADGRQPCHRATCSAAPATCRTTCARRP